MKKIFILFFWLLSLTPNVFSWWEADRCVKGYVVHWWMHDVPKEGWGNKAFYGWADIAYRVHYQERVVERGYARILNHYKLETQRVNTPYWYFKNNTEDEKVKYLNKKTMDVINEKIKLYGMCN